MRPRAAVVGESRFPRRDFARRLGPSAFLVWSLLTRRRDADGMAHPTVAGLANSKEGQRLSERSVKRALARLRRAGLVEDLGWRLLEVPGSDFPEEVYVRRVLGDFAGDFIQLPMHVWPRVAALQPSGHGGARRGAGRPPEYASAEAWAMAQRLRGRLYAQWARWEKTGRAGCDPEYGFSYAAIFERVGRRPGPGSEWHLDHVIPLSKFDLTRSEDVLRASAPENFQWLPREENLRKSSNLPKWVQGAILPPPAQPLLGPIQGAILPPGGRGQVASGVEGASGPPIYAQASSLRSDPFPSEKDRSQARELVKMPLPDVMVAKSLSTMPHLERAWRKFATVPRGPRFPLEELMPPHPEPGEIFVTTPPPPRVAEHLESGDQLAFCARWFRAAVESRGLECPPLAPRGSHRRYFEDFLEVCLDKRIRPGAWVAWALDRILVRLPTNARRRFRPQIKVLLSSKTLTEGRWMFREAEGAYCTPHMAKSQAGEAFMARRYEVRDLILAAQASRAEADAIVARVFPEGYREARQACAENTRAAGQEVLERIRFGEWLWPLPAELRGARGEATGR